MPRITRSNQEECLSPISQCSVSQNASKFLRCPFKGFDACKNGVRGRGLVRSSFSKHFNDQHLVNGKETDRCRDRIRSNGAVYALWEETLVQLRMWMCTKCMHLQSWKKCCRSHEGDVISAPFNGMNADFLIHNVTKPVEVSASIPVYNNDNVEHSNSVQALDVELLDKVFQAQLHTIRHIPTKCRLSFSRTFKQTMDKVILSPLDISAWIQLLLFPICVLSNYPPKSSAEGRSGMRKKLQVAYINQALAKWRDSDGCVSLVLDLLSANDLLSKHKVLSKNKNPDDISLKLCRRKLSQGSYTAAIRVLTSNGVAPSTDATLSDLQLKHPLAPPPVLPTVTFEVDAASASSDMVLNRIRSFSRGTACCRDGLHAQHLLDALSGPAAAMADELLASITAIVNLLLAGKCPPQLGKFIASAPLTPLLKPGGGIRPIAVGTIWRRLVSKVAASLVSKDMTRYLSDFQFGVGVPCGGEAILHSANRILEEKCSLSSLSMLLVDFSNAFNLVDRSAMLREVRFRCPIISKWVEFCYAFPANLYYGASTLSSAQGVQQGDPLGPLLFSLTLHPLVLKISQQCQLDLQAWYLDDGTIIGDTLQVSKAFHIIQNEGASVGLHLNVEKIELFWPSTATRSLQDGIFPADIGRSSIGVKLLGGPVSLNAKFCSQMVLERVQKTLQLMAAVHKLEDPQSELLLLRNCTGVSKLYFTMRTAAPKYVKEAQVLFDNHLSKYMRVLVTGDGPGYGLLQQRLVSLPIRDGVLEFFLCLIPCSTAFWLLTLKPFTFRRISYVIYLQIQHVLAFQLKVQHINKLLTILFKCVVLIRLNLTISLLPPILCIHWQFSILQM